MAGQEWAVRYAELVASLGALIASRGVDYVADEDTWSLVAADLQDAANDALPEDDKAW